MTESVDDDAPFFIVGCGRSGTTLLRLVLSGHSRIEIPPETWFLLTLVERLPLTETLSPAQVEEAIALMTGDYRWPDMAIAAADFAQGARALAEPRIADLMGLVYSEHLRRAGKPRFGDKTPPYIGILPQLASIYPGARFIHLIRDGRDVATSFIDAHFDGGVWDKQFEWRRAVRHGLAYRSSALAERILEVRYEDMVKDLEATTRLVCGFLGEAFEPGMLDFQPLIARKVPARERVVHHSLSRAVSADSVAAWRTRLSGAELFLIESCIRAELVALGYQPRFASRAWTPAMRLSRAVLATTGPHLRRVIQGLRRRDLLRRQVYI
ncbi:MAG: sulfotransferase [Acetobacteraceae bacterium]